MNDPARNLTPDPDSWRIGGVLLNPRRSPFDSRNTDVLELASYDLDD
jgi:hypothetical protein